MTHVSKAVCAMLAFAVSLATPELARAQSQATTAEINGRLSDAQGGVLPGVTVTARAPKPVTRATTVTNEEGLFSLPLLPPGTYEVTAELSGFATFKQTVRPTVGATITLNHAMGVAGVQEAGDGAKPRRRSSRRAPRFARPPWTRTRSVTCRSTDDGSRTS